MTYEQNWAVIMLVVVVAAAALAIWAKHLREAKRLALREMIHAERMTALEKGVTPPDWPAEPGSPADAGGDARWTLARAARFGGLVLVFGGMGLMASFFLMPRTPEMQGLGDMASMGLLPLFTGIGLLLYAWLERRARGEAHP